MDWKRILGLALASVALALVVWGLFFAIPGGSVSIKVDLPPAERAPAEPNPVHVYLNRDGALRVGDKRSSLDLLVGDIVGQAGSPDKTLQRIVLHENVEVSHADYRAVMDRIKAAGWLRIELDTQRGDPK